MAIRFGSGSDGSRNPLTPDEAAMARVLVNAIRDATDKIKVDELARILGRLDADTLDKFSSPSKKKNAEETPAE
jgi:hypothetical protein